MEIKIAYMFPDLLNLYGDKGNINALWKRLAWRGIGCEIKQFDINSHIDLSDIDIVFLGGGSDRDQIIVSRKLMEEKEQISDYIENDGVMIAVCGGYQLMGKYCEYENEKVEGLGILDLYTEHKKGRLMGNVIIDSPLTGCKITGFENHSGRTFSSTPPLGKVLYGNGNNGKDKSEGAVYKNLIGTYLHGPILPANPKLTDLILTKALNKKYGNIELSALDDSAEDAAREYIINKYL